jgi:glyoxylase-like metal-dependent hydrolase (beta-lactamase superfamily II)
MAVGARVLSAQEDTTRIETVSVAPGLFMLVGRGGNIGVSAGDDGVFLVDDQYAPLSGRIVDAVRKLSPRPIRFIVNTHWHGDHTGGNENFGKEGVVIVAHDNVRQRMSVEQFLVRFNTRVPASPKAALPVVTFGELVTFHLNGETIHAIHVKNAHTDGDAVVHFQRANALHMGDTFFNGMYPFIDLGSGGSIDGVISAATTALGYANDQTKIIPGHGPLATKGDLLAYRDMLVAAREKIRAAMVGKTLAQVLAANPTASWDAKWGGGFMKPADFVSAVFESLSAAPKPD